MFRIFAILCVLVTCWAQDCTVSNFKVMNNYEPKKANGTWYAVAKKDEKYAFMLDNIIVKGYKETDGSVTGIITGRTIIGLCVNILVTFEHSPDPAKCKMKYRGTIPFLQNRADDVWIIDTDYDNYLIQYTCLQLDTDGTCLDGYSHVFSRYQTGLRSEDEQIIEQKKKEICLLGKYRPVNQNVNYGSWYDHVTGWWEKSQTYPNLLYLHYEDMSEDMDWELDRVCSFLGVCPNEEERRRVKEGVKFDAMKNNSMTNYSLSKNMDTKISPFIRKGKVGDWKNHFTVSQNEQFDKEYEKKMVNTTLRFRTEI